MIFKTLDSDTDKFFSKIGIFGKSINSIKDDTKKLIKDINFAIKNKEAFNDPYGLETFKYRRGSGPEKTLDDIRQQFIVTKKDIEPFLKDMKAFENFDAGGVLKQLKKIEVQSLTNKDAWANYYRELEAKKDPKLDFLRKFVNEGGIMNRTVGDLTSAYKAGKISAEEYNTELHNLTTGAKSANVVLKGLAMAGNMLAAWAISEAIQFIIKAVDESIVTFNEQLEILEETKQAYADVTSEVEKLDEELVSIGKQIDDINGLENLSFTDKEELKRLEKLRRETERLYNVEKTRQAALQQQRNEDFVETYEKYFNNTDGDEYYLGRTADGKELRKNTWYNRLLSWYYNANAYNGIIYTKAVESASFEDYLSEYKKYYNELANLQERYASGDEVNLDYTEEKIKEIGAALTAELDRLKNMSSGISYIENPVTELDNQVNERLDYYNDMTDKYNILMGSENAVQHAFNRLIDNWKFDDVTDVLEELGEQGKVTASMLNDPKYDDFLEKLVYIGIIDTVDDLEAVASAFNKVGESIEDAGKKSSISDIFALESSNGELTDLGKLSEKVDQIQEAFSGLKEAMDSYKETGKFTVDQLQSILSFGDKYLPYLINEQCQLELNEEAILRVAAARLQDMRIQTLDNLMTRLEGITDETTAEKFLKTALLEEADARNAVTEARIQAWKAERLADGMDPKLINEVTREISRQRDAINELYDNVDVKTIWDNTEEAAKDAAEILELSLAELDARFDAGLIDFNDYINKRRDLIEDYYRDNKDKAAEYYDFLKQHYERELEIRDKVLNAVQRRFDKEIEGIEDVIDGIEKQNDALEKQKELLENAAQAVVDYYDKMIEQQEKAIEGYEKQNEEIEEQMDSMDKAAQAVISYYQELQEEQQDRIDALEEENDELNKQLELQNTILGGIDKVYQDEIDLLSEDQKLLQEKIDSLNDEADAYDAVKRKEEALYALRRSEEQRVKKVYIDDKGYFYDTDKDAVRENRDNLLKLENEEIIKALENEKDALQDAIDKLEDYRKSWSELGSVWDDIKKSEALKEYFGDDYIDRLLNFDPDDVDSLKNQIIETNTQVENNNSLIESIQGKIDGMQAEIDKWNELSSAVSENENKQAAEQQFGANWQELINQGKLVDFQDFVDKYLGLDKKLNDNQVLIDSTNEKIEYYQTLKDEWSNLSSVLDEEIKKQAASQVFGTDWEAQINDGRLMAFSEFATNYKAVEAQINDNNAMIESHNEKIQYYNDLKDKWSEITTAHENAVEDQIAAMILGDAWEETILKNRGDVLEDFKNRYIELQKQITTAAWNSAQEQVDAAKLASSVGGSTEGPDALKDYTWAGGDFNYDNVNTETKKNSEWLAEKLKAEAEAAKAEALKRPEQDWLFEETIKSANEILSSEPTEAIPTIADRLLPQTSYVIQVPIETPTEFAEEVSKAVEENLTHDEYRNKNIIISKYHTGLEKGRVDNHTFDDDFDVVQKYGLKKVDIPAILERNEAVITKEQISNLADALRVIPIQREMLKTVTVPNSYAYKSAPTQPVIQNISISLPNITNDGGYDALVKFLERSVLGAMQYVNKK